MKVSVKTEKVTKIFTFESIDEIHNELNRLYNDNEAGLDEVIHADVHSMGLVSVNDLVWLHKEFERLDLKSDDRYVKVPMIKIIRNRTGLDLRKSKDLVETIFSEFLSEQS